MNDKTLKILSVISIILGLIMLPFILDYSYVDGYFEEEDDRVRLTGTVTEIRGERAVVNACRDIVVYGDGLLINEEYDLYGSMYKGIINIEKIEKK